MLESFFVCLFPLLFMLAAGSGVGALIYFAIQAEKKRKLGIANAAEEMGLTYFENGSPSLENLLSNFELFEGRRSKNIKNMIYGDTETEQVGVFDYTYVTGSGKNRTTHHQTVVFIQSPSLQLPSFSLRPEYFFHKIASAFGYQDINFESHPRFSKAFLLRGADEDAIRQFFTPTILEFFEQRPGICVEGAGPRLIFYKAGERIAPQDFAKHMDEGFQAYRQLRS